MAAGAHPSFEVATVKPSDPNNGSEGFHLRGHRVSIENETVQKMMMFSYGVHVRQIVNQPAWVDAEKFDVDGVPDAAGQPDFKQMQEMVQKLLADRFHLKVHRDRREMNVYALRVAKGGPKITKTASGPDALPDQTGNGRMMRFTANSMEDFAGGLKYLVDEPVVDQTGLAGRFDFTLRWAPEGPPSDDPNAAQPLSSAIPEQLGLRLDTTKAPTEVLVMDGVERPSAN